MIDESKYPQLAKMEAMQDESQTIGAFLDWLGQQKMHVATYIVPEGHVYEKLVPIHDGTEALLARYFEIDLNAVERERRAVLANFKTPAPEGQPQ